MKKEMNGKSRRKWVVGGAMVFGSVALLSTGFATWVIGALNNNVDQELTVGVDAVKNESITVTSIAEEGVTDYNIFIADENKTDGLVRVADSKRDLTVTIKLKAVFSEEYGEPGDVTATFKGNSNQIPAANIDNLHSDITTRNWATGRTKTGENYEVFANTIVATDPGSWTPKAPGTAAGTFESTRTIKYTFSIGGIWKDNSFAKHVDSVYSDATADAALYGEIETEMEEEIAAITSYFTTNKLTLHLEVAKNNA